MAAQNRASSATSVRPTSTVVDDGERLPRVITGRAVPYETATNLGNVDETIDPAAFRDSLTAQPAIPLLTYHDRSVDPVGVATRWEHRRDGLYGTWRLADSPRAREVARMVRDGVLRYLSIGFQPIDAEWTVERATGREQVRIVRGRLLEVSLVSTPAYVSAEVTSSRADRALVELAGRLMTPRLIDAIDGAPADVATAVELVRRHVEQHGAAAPAHLAEIAIRTRDARLAINLGRACSALADADAVELERVCLGRLRAELDMSESVANLNRRQAERRRQRQRRGRGL